MSRQLSLNMSSRLALMTATFPRFHGCLITSLVQPFLQALEDALEFPIVHFLDR